MLPSSTVENYLKVIHLQQLTLSDPTHLVGMGQLASAMGVTPGTATTMVKALNEAGLVHYEPYVGVRLLPAGERLAGLVIRRHRLVELFLVRVMGMSWDEVHDEAEKLEHVVSERLIERMDEMLGHPEVDPHGDPIPNSEGVVTERELPSLLTCPMGVPLTVTRVADQDAAFLRFLEQSHLKPGQELRVESRDEAADSVRVRCKGAEPLTIGARAASKLLVEVLTVAVFVLALMTSTGAQAPSTAAQASAAKKAASEPFAITDNSFFVEEAFNQEPRVFQNIGGALFSQDDWAVTFTQEWPAPSMKHQLSYTVSVLNSDDETGPGDALLNYRYQLFEEGPGRPAISPRVSVIVPVGDEERGLGQGGWGLQFNLPVSKQVGDFYLHGNAGLGWLPSVPTDHFPSAGFAPAQDVSLVSPFIAGSAIYRVRQMFNLMLESVVAWDEDVVAASATDRETAFILSPGARAGWNIGEKQIVVGLAFPFSRQGGETSAGVFGYFSYELPF
jgi:DtxR family transcriptional regulator, Mn-dependent transcriptional regulator